MVPDRPLTFRRSHRSGHVGLTGRVLAVAATVALLIDAYVHLHDAGFYDSVTTSVVSQGTLFRVEAGLALAVGIALLVRPVQIVWAATLTIAASAFGAVMLYTYLDPGRLGPIPNMYEPTWALPGKLASAWAEGACTIVAMAGLCLSISRSRTRPHRRDISEADIKLETTTDPPGSPPVSESVGPGSRATLPAALRAGEEIQRSSWADNPEPNRFRRFSGNRGEAGHEAAG